MKSKLFSLIKGLSTVLMTAALSLEAWHFYGGTLPAILTPVLWLARFAVAAHALEAVIAAVMAPAQQKPALRYAIYTFFVGTVGLYELWEGRKMSREGVSGI